MGVQTERILRQYRIQSNWYMHLEGAFFGMRRAVSMKYVPVVKSPKGAADNSPEDKIPTPMAGLASYFNVASTIFVVAIIKTANISTVYALWIIAVKGASLLSLRDHSSVSFSGMFLWALVRLSIWFEAQRTWHSMSSKFYSILAYLRVPEALSIDRLIS